jgi:UDP-N-acetylmuramyl pentapeptide phosphotransferase/UDP-N-acetylglucosamine-1-phosphate transferase
MIAFAIMIVITPFLRRIAFKIDYTEKPKPDQERKVHKEPKPYLAAVGIFLSFWILYFSFIRDFSSRTFLLFAGSFLIFAIGMMDDWVKIKGGDLKALPKMLVQVTACVLVFKAGITIQGFSNPFNGTYINLPEWIQFILTVLWLFGVTTVINFTDGLDGLAGGITCITACTLFVVALAKGQSVSALMSITLVGICLGYLRYNKFPAKILMGDAGATFLGFILGVISPFSIIDNFPFEDRYSIELDVPLVRTGILIRPVAVV